MMACTPIRPRAVCAGVMVMMLGLGWLLTGWGSVADAAAPAGPVTLTWTEQHPAASPPARNAAMIAYDPATSTTMLFGGSVDPGDLADTWTWDGTTWTERHPATSPPDRYGAALAYDPAIGKLVLWGGAHAIDGTYYADTCTWDGTTWTEQPSPTSPPAGYGAAMTYDPATSSMLLFGGENGLADTNSTWSWTSSGWTQLAPASSPPARYAAAMTYDAAAGSVVLFGGLDLGLTYFADTWTWHGQTWTAQAPAAAPSARAFSALAYDPSLGLGVLFGGSVGSVVDGDTWTWNGRTWTELSAAPNPPPRGSIGTTAYDVAHDQLVLFGGFQTASLRDTWTATLRVPQPVTMSSAPRSPVRPGGAYRISATGGGSGNPVVLAIAPASARICRITGHTVTFLAPGTCVIQAHQAGNNSYLAGSAQQSVTVTAAVTSTPPVRPSLTPSTGPVGPTAPALAATGTRTGRLTGAALALLSGGALLLVLGSRRSRRHHRARHG